MKANHVLLIAFFISLNACQSDNRGKTGVTTGNSVIIGQIRGYHPKFSENVIQLHLNNILKDDSEQYLAKVDKSGSFIFHYNVNYPQETMLRYSGASISLLSFPNDTIRIEMEVDHLDSFDPTVELIQAKSRNLKYGNFVNEFQKFSHDLMKKHKTSEVVQGSFEHYCSLMSQQHFSKEKYLDSMLNVRPDLDSILVLWGKEHIKYGYLSQIINYYSINRMLNKSHLRKNNITEAMIEEPIDLSYQPFADTILRDVEIGRHTSRLSSSYAIFLNGISAYNSFQYNPKNDETYLSDFPKYLNDHFEGDDFELLYTRFIYNRMQLVEKHGGKDQLAEFEVEYPKLLSILRDAQYVGFLNAEFARIEELIKSGTPRALKYDLVEFPGTDDFWTKQIIDKNKGKVLYIKFWAPWCGPCMGNWQSVNNLVAKYHNERFAMISLCLDTEKEEWDKAIKKHKITGIHYLLTKDQSSTLMSSFGIGGIPYNLLVSKRGEIKYFDAMTTGASDGNLNQTLLMQIDNLLDE